MSDKEADKPQFVIVRESKPDGRAKPKRGPSADEARETLRCHLAEISACALARHDVMRELGLDEIKDVFDPLHYAIKAMTGVGKSDLSRQEVASYYIPEAKRMGLPHRVLIAVPTHKLADEARSKMPEGGTVAVWQGRGGTHLETGEPMCGDLPAVNAALEIGAAVEETACKSKTARCALYEICWYQKQKAAARTADIVYVAHEALFQAPKAIGKGFGLIIVDESFWQTGLTTKSSLVISSLADELKTFPVRYKGVSEIESWTDDLRKTIRQLQHALDQMPDGYVLRQPLVDAGLAEPAIAGGDSPCTNAGKLEWQRKVETKLRPGVSEEQRKAAVEKFGFMGQLRRRHRMWRSLHELIAGNDAVSLGKPVASGQLLIETIKTKNGPVRCLRLLGRKDIAAKLKDLPLIVADATLPFELVKNYMPSLELICDLNVEAPHMKVTQVIGLPVGKSSLQPLKAGKRKPGEEERVGRKRQRLADAVRHLTQGRRGLVITYQSIEDDFWGIEGVEVAHFGAVAGIDRWGDVDVLVMIGRPFPKSEDIQNMAAAITGKPVIAGVPMVQECKVLKGPLAGRIIKRKIFGTPEAEMTRQAVTEAAVEQALGRVRGVNRTAANPVEVFLILDDTIVPGIEVDEVIDFSEIEPGAVDEMIIRGLIPQMPSDAAKIYPDLFPSRKAAQKAYQRAGLRLELGPPGPRLATSPNKIHLSRRCRQPPRVALRFQPGGRGQLPRFCIANLVKVPDPRAVLEAALGPLALFEVLTMPEPAAADSEAAE